MLSHNMFHRLCALYTVPRRLATTGRPCSALVLTHNMLHRLCRAQSRCNMLCDHWSPVCAVLYLEHKVDVTCYVLTQYSTAQTGDHWSPVCAVLYLEHKVDVTCYVLTQEQSKSWQSRCPSCSATSAQSRLVYGTSSCFFLLRTRQSADVVK